MRIAIITAMAEETLPIFKKLGNVVAQNTISGVAISQIEYDGDTIYLATSGVGEIKAERYWLEFAAVIKEYKRNLIV